MRSCQIVCLGLLLALGPVTGFLWADAYDPLQSTQAILTEDITLVDRQRQREIPVRIFMPREAQVAPVVLFSHGLGGSRENSSYLGKHLAGRGYVCLFVQHPGSDTSIWRGPSQADRQASMRGASNPQNWVWRIDDIQTVVAALPQWNSTKGHPLFGRVDTKRIGMSGHSFGALTTLGTIGQQFPMTQRSFVVPEIRAGICYSPSLIRPGNEQRSFREINRPVLLMTGTKDETPRGGTTESRRKVYPAMPSTIDRYELVLDGGTHLSYAERNIPFNGAAPEPRNPNHHRVILGLTTAFWDTYLREDADARTWLQGTGPRTILEKADAWQFEVAK